MTFLTTVAGIILGLILGLLIGYKLGNFFTSMKTEIEIKELKDKLEQE